MTDTITVKVHPDAECTFERIAAPSEAPPAEVNCVMNKDFQCYVYCVALGEWGWGKIMEIKEASLASRAITCTFWVISGLGAFGHMGYAAYLIDFHRGIDNGNISTFVILLVFTFLFIFINSFLYRRYVTRETYDKGCHLILVGGCIFLFLIYVALAGVSIGELFYEGYNIQGIVSCILCVLASCGTGYLVLTIIILFVIWLIMTSLELIFGSIVHFFFYYACCKGLCMKDDPQAAYDKNRPPDCSLYYYDRSKTTVTQCSICLCDFKLKARICVGRCHATHIFHAKCLNSWLKNRSNCPICTSTSGFR